MLKYYLEEMFEPTLLYGTSLAVIGVATAAHYGHFSAFYGLLAIIGSALAQMSVNVISDYFDYESGLDRKLIRTKKDNLSGGSTLIAKGLIKPNQTLAMGLLIFAVAGIIGLYLLYVRIQLLPILIIAIVSILLYARYVKKVPYLSEPLCTLNYTLIALGSFIVVAGNAPLPYGLIFLLIPSGILLGGDALYVNEVPDRKIDEKFGIKHSAVMLKTSKKIGLYYLGMQSAAFILMILGVILGYIPIICLAVLITYPTTAYVYMGLSRAGAKNYGKYLFIHTLSSITFAIILSLSLISGTVAL